MPDSFSPPALGMRLCMLIRVCFPAGCFSVYAVGKSAERGNFTIISLGQGQEGPAERVLDKYMAEVRAHPGVGLLGSPGISHVCCWAGRAGRKVCGSERRM